MLVVGCFSTIQGFNVQHVYQTTVSRRPAWGGARLFAIAVLRGVNGVAGNRVSLHAGLVVRKWPVSACAATPPALPWKFRRFHGRAWEIVQDNGRSFFPANLPRHRAAHPGAATRDRR